MKHDFTMFGVGLIIGNVGLSLFWQTTTILNAVTIGIGLLIIVGSRYGLFGRRA